MPPAAILDRPEHSARLWPLTLDAYHALGEAGLIPEKTELLYGFVFNKMPKTPLHTALVQRLRELIEALRLQGRHIRQEQPLTCGSSEPEPDIAVVAGQPGDYWDSHPQTAALVIEVAVTSEDYDREKAAAYAGAGIAEYWIVISARQQIEIFSEPDNGAYRSKRIIEATQQAMSALFPGLVITPADLLTR